MVSDTRAGPFVVEGTSTRIQTEGKLRKPASPPAVVDFAVLAALAQVASAIVVIVGVWFAVVQIREFRRQREDTAAVELVRSIQTPETLRSLMVVWGLPEGLDAQGLRKRGAEAEEATLSMVFALENLGPLVYQRAISLRSVDLLIGAIARDSWRKLKVYVLDQRARLGTPNWGEWFQWLAERLEEHPVEGKSAGAYQAFRSWRP